mgnify:CR=1 FL=1
MKKLYICITFIFALNMTGAQNFNIGNESDNKCFSYTASGYQDVVNGNHSKAINESRKIANLVAEHELLKIIKKKISRVVQMMSLECDEYKGTFVDTTMISVYKVLKGMKTVYQSETKLIDNTYVTYITKEISYDVISDMFDNDDDKLIYKTLLEKVY